MSPRGWGAIAGATATTVMACTLLSGVGDLQEVSCPTCGSDAAVPDAAEASSRDASDAASIDTGACRPTGPEVCTDGVDNDCNGKIDCADPACASFSCVPAPPAGWTLEAVDLSARPACPGGLGPAADLVVDPDLSAATCACVCTVETPPSCVTGTVHELAGDVSSCADASVYDRPVDGGCNAIGAGTVAGYHEITPLGPTGGACVPSVQVGIPTSAQGRACPVPSGGGGCPPGDVCAPSTAPFATCIVQPGTASCPSSYGRMHAAGSALVDTRGCGSSACACGKVTATCTNASLAFYADIACLMLSATAPVDGMCDPTTGTGATAAIVYSATTTGPSCPVSGPSPPPVGSATITNPETLCCR